MRWIAQDDRALNGDNGGLIDMRWYCTDLHAAWTLLSEAVPEMAEVGMGAKEVLSMTERNLNGIPMLAELSPEEFARRGPAN